MPRSEKISPKEILNILLIDDKIAEKLKQAVFFGKDF